MEENARQEAVEKIVAEARKGSKQAFSSLVGLHQGRVRAYLGRFIQDRDIVDDIAQETFLAAYRKFDTFRGEAPLGIWLVGIARNLALMHLRDEERRRSRGSQLLESALAGWQAGQLDAEGRVSEHERELAALEACIQKLPARSADLVASYYSAESRSAVEIARELGRKQSTVRVALLRIRQALRECIELELQGQGAKP